MNTEKIDNVEIEGIDFKDYPDFCDAFIVSADYNGIPLTDDEINKLNDNSEFIHEKIFDQMH